MLQGLGDTYAQTLNLSGGTTAQRIIELFLFNFNFTSESETQEALGQVGGQLRTKSSAEGTVTDTLTLSTQFVDWAQLGFTVDEFPKTETNLIWPGLKPVTVPTTTPFEISDATITPANDNFFFAFVNAFGAWGQPGSLVRTADATTAPANAGEVQIDTANNKLVFHSSLAGAPVSYTAPTTYTTIQAYGGPGTATKYGKISFRGKLFTPESTENWGIYFPSLSRNGRPNFEITGEVPELSIPFAAETPSGWEKPYQIVNFDTGEVV